MSNALIASMRERGMRFALIIACLAVLLLAGCAPGSQQRVGTGVDMEIMNHQALQDLYFSDRLPEQGADFAAAMDLSPDAKYVRIGDLSVALHNAGYADTLVALYVTGYDPNLFALAPLGPYILQDEPRACYQDIRIDGDDGWSVYGVCSVGDGVYVGGGVVGAGTDAERARAEAYGVNADKWLDALAGMIGGEKAQIFEDIGLFSDLDVVCESPTQNVNLKDVNCRLQWGDPSFYYQRSSRGALALALFGGALRECGNGCVVVPSPVQPDRYLAGNTERFPGGEVTFVDYAIFLDKNRWPPNLNDHEQLFQVTACYLYTTYATPVVCIDPTPFGTEGEVCRAGVLQMETQPAPLRITSIEQSNQGPRVMFTINVENARQGRAFAPGAVDFCTPAAAERNAREVRDQAYVLDARVLGSLERLDCRDDVIRLQNGRGSINCFYELPPNLIGRAAYQTTLNIEIGYLYREQATLRSDIHRI